MLTRRGLFGAFLALPFVAKLLPKRAAPTFKGVPLAYTEGLDDGPLFPLPADDSRVWAHFTDRDGWVVRPPGCEWTEAEMRQEGLVKFLVFPRKA